MTATMPMPPASSPRCTRRLWTVLSVALGFLAGAASGAVAYAATGVRGASLAVAIVAASRCGRFIASARCGECSHKINNGA